MVYKKMIAGEERRKGYDGQFSLLVPTFIALAFVGLIALFNKDSKEDIPKPSKLEKQAQTINVTKNDTLVDKSGNKYIVDYDLTGKLNLIPYNKVEK